MNTLTNDDLIKHYNTYSKMIYRLAFIQMKTKEQAEDILQDVFVKLMGYNNNFENDEHLKAWLLRTTINCCKDHWKSAWFKKRASLDEISEIPMQASPTNSIGFVTECVKKLPTKYRYIIHLYYYEEYSAREIAEVMGVSESAVGQYLTRGRRKLRTIITDEERRVAL